MDVYERLTRGVRKPIKHKFALLSCGAAGVGKTTTQKMFLQDAGLTTTFVYLNQDSFWDLYSSQEEARSAFKQCVSQVIEDGYSFFLDGTCRYTPETERLIQRIKQRGYTVKVSITYAKMATVLRRLVTRTHQRVPADLAKDIYDEVSRRIESLMKNPNIDEIFLYDNETTTRLLYHKSAKKISCLFPDTAFYFDVSKYC